MPSEQDLEFLKSGNDVRIELKESSLLHFVIRFHGENFGSIRTKGVAAHVSDKSKTFNKTCF